MVNKFPRTQLAANLAFVPKSTSSRKYLVTSRFEVIPSENHMMKGFLFMDLTYLF